MEERYCMIECIGTGAGGEVYKAFDRHLHRYVAVKKTKKNAPLAREEAGVLKGLKHPAIPIVYDVYRKKDETFMVMEYMTGKSLLSILEAGEPFSEERAVAIGLRIGECLKYLHGLPEKLIYRDLKPANLILDVGDEVKLIDFDSAVAKGMRFQEKVMTGTFGYSAPEQFETEGIVDERSDIYSFGTTMYHMLTGKNPSKPPFRFLKIRECNPFISEGLEKIVETCMERDRNKRYANMEEVLKALRTYNKEAGKRKRIRVRKRYMREEKKNILLTEKYRGGLFVMLFFLAAGVVSLKCSGGKTENVFLPRMVYAQDADAAGEDKAVKNRKSNILPVVFYNRKGETILIKEHTFYETDADFHMAIPKEIFSCEKGAKITVICTDLKSGEEEKKEVLLKVK